MLVGWGIWFKHYSRILWIHHENITIVVFLSVMKINIAVKKLKWGIFLIMVLEKGWIPIESKQLTNLNNFEQIINVFIYYYRDETIFLNTKQKNQEKFKTTVGLLLGE